MRGLCLSDVLIVRFSNSLDVLAFWDALTSMHAILVPVLAFLNTIVDISALLAINKPTRTAGRGWTSWTCRRC